MSSDDDLLMASAGFVIMYSLLKKQEKKIKTQALVDDFNI